jgi:hypothetical protein
MVNINWGAAMTAAQEGRLAEFFRRVLERKDDTEREKVAYKVDGFTQFTEDCFRKFAEDYAYLLGVNEGLATLDVIQDGVKTGVAVEELLAKAEEFHNHTMCMFREGEKIDDTEDNGIATRLYKIAYEFHKASLQNCLKGETK